MSKEISRRDFLKGISLALGELALSAMLPSGVRADVGLGNFFEYFGKKAEKNAEGKYILHNSDGVEVAVDLSKAIGFTPDKGLMVSSIKAKVLGVVPKDAGDFQAYLNTERDGYGKLAGHTDGTNDYNQYGKKTSSPQVPVYSWMVHTGEEIEMPGIGKVVGGEGRAVMVLILNRTPRVCQFPEESVRVNAGYEGWGRIWNGDEQPVAEAEKRLVNHYLVRLGQGVPETGFIGQCDLPDNCNKVTVVTVERMQWGNNHDGTPRDQFRLIRAETVPAAKK